MGKDSGRLETEGIIHSPSQGHGVKQREGSSRGKKPGARSQGKGILGGGGEKLIQCKRSLTNYHALDKH